MKRDVIAKLMVGVAAFGFIAAGFVIDGAQAQMKKPPFGRKADVDYGNSLWKALEKAHLVGADAIQSGLYKGTPPHGDVLETMRTKVTVRGHTGTVIVKRNYGGKDMTVEKVNGHRAEHLKWVTVMFQRKKGYDTENKDWFWAKFSPSGGYDKHPEAKVPLVGRVGSRKTGAGCIGCHQNAAGGDMVYFNSPQ